MKKSTMIWLAAAAFLTVLGLVMFVGAVAADGWDFDGLSSAKYETNIYETNGAFDSISISVETTEIRFAPSEDEKCRIVCFESEKVRHSAVVKDGRLTIGTIDTRKWYDYIGINFETPKMTVYLPQKIYDSLSVFTATGNIDIPGDFSFQDLEIVSDIANIKCLASVSNAMEINSKTGTITADSLSADAIRLSTTTGGINVSSVVSGRVLEINVSTGPVRLTDITCTDFTVNSSTGTISLKNVIAEGNCSIKTSTGNVRFDDCDAAQISVRTSTGAVTGTLLSEKIFITETSTGHVNVPKSISGGRCEITTSTGNINIYTPN